MRLRLLFIFFNICVILPVTAQQACHINGNFSYTDGFEKVYLVSFKDSTQVLAESPLKEGHFALPLKSIPTTGIYRLQYGPNMREHFVDVLFTAKDTAIALNMDLREEVREPQFKGSPLNQKLYAYLLQQKKDLAQLRFNYQTWHSAPDKQQAAAQLSAKEFNKWYKILIKSEYEFIKQNESNLAGLYVKANPLWLPDLALEPKEVSVKKIDNYWQNLPITNEALQNTPFYTSYLMEYLAYHFNQHLDPEPWEAQMKKAVDKALAYMSQTDYTNKLTIKYLIEGFKAIGHEGLLQYVDEKYAQNVQCLETRFQEDVDYRLLAYKIGKPGQEVPNFAITPTQDLYSNINRKTIFVFWSSTCPHCMQEWPAITTWEKEHPDFQIIAISLDTDKNSYEATKAKLPTSILYLCDFKGYESEYVKPFYIMATPTIFEVDSNKNFVKKGKGIHQFGE
jgi:thiol-disulfide isomerase/thioredoxin